MSFGMLSAEQLQFLSELCAALDSVTKDKDDPFEYAQLDVRILGDEGEPWLQLTDELGTWMVTES